MYVEKLEFEDAKLMGGKFKNFSGKANEYNREGNRYINVVIPENKAQQLADLGWTIKELPPREEGDPSVFFMKVNIKFKQDGAKSDPKIFKGISQDNMHRVNYDSIGDLDRDEIDHIDMVVRPYHWGKEGEKNGISAWLDEMYVIIKGSRFTSKYNVIDEELDEEVDD